MLVLLLAAAVAHPAPVFTGCEHRPRTRPQAVTIACGDGNLYATGLRWSSWTADGAAAVGTGHVNDCTPYCAAGHFHTAPIALRLSDPVTCVRGRRELARIAWRWTGPRPKGTARTGSETLPCSFLRVRP